MPEYNCKSIILEKGYYDKDFLGGYSRFFCKRNFPPLNRCDRLHFFSHELQLDTILRENFENLAENYLGYIIICPTEHYRVGRSILTTPKLDNVCSQKYSVSISGTKFYVSGVPFINKDGNVTMCAQAALWMYLRYLHHQYQIVEYTPLQITLMASKSSYRGEREIPTSGLTEFEMAQVLKEMSLTPLIIDRVNRTNIKEHISPYLIANIPILASAFKYFNEDTNEYISACNLKEMEHVHSRGHAFLLIGFNENRRLDDINFVPYQQKLRYFNYANQIQSVLKHDDKDGPYILAKNEFREGEESVSELFNNYILSEIGNLLVALPENVFLTHEDAIKCAKEYLENLDSLIMTPSLQRPDILTSFLAKNITGGIILRLYIIEARCYKEHIKKEDVSLSPEIKNLYLWVKMPKYIWVAEISTIQYAQQQKIIGEIIIDSTSDTSHPQCIAIHVPGFLKIKDNSIKACDNSKEYTFDNASQAYIRYR